MNTNSNISELTQELRLSSIPGLIELREGVDETIVCRPANPEASKEEIRVSSSLCVDHLCGCKSS